MSVEHEQRCERTIASVVDNIDDLKHELAEEKAAANRVRAIHYMIRIGNQTPIRLQACAHCDKPWPCRTIEALETP